MLFVSQVGAACPVCIVGVGGGLVLAEWLGIDDLLVSIWIMGLLCAVSFWWASWLDKKTKKADLPGRFLLTNGYAWSILMFLLTVVYYMAGNKLGWNTLWGIDRLIFGSILGTIFFFLSQWLESYLRRKNENKVYFPYQKVVLPLASLLLATGVGVVLLLANGISL